MFGSFLNVIEMLTVLFVSLIITTWPEAPVIYPKEFTVYNFCVPISSHPKVVTVLKISLYQDLNSNLFRVLLMDLPILRATEFL